MLLSDITEAIVDCEHKTAPKGDGYAYAVGTKAMKGGRFIKDDAKPVSQRTYDEWTRRMRPLPGDLILAREAPVGDVVRVPDHPLVCLGQRTVLIRPDAGMVHPRFLHYWLLGPDAQGVMRAQTGGATVGHLNVGDIRKLDVEPMPKNERHQANAAEVLGTIDDLIENNRRRVEVLEEMARAIYQEWFVKFRYPGHSDVPLVDSALGPIPEGWDTARLGELAEVRRGISWERSNETAGGTPVVTIPNVRSRLVLAGATELASVSDADRLRFGLRDGDLILIGSNGNADRVGHTIRVPNTVEALFASFLMRVRVHDARTSSLVVFHQLTDPRGVIADIRATAVGSTGLRNLRITALREAQVLLPPAFAVARFDSECGPIVRLADQLGEQNDRLESLRDVLLPKLVTGQIDASALDLDVLLGEQVA
jgi:type I restriction enzyme, S subunit